MPRIFDNINEKLLDTLQHSLSKAKNADFCVGYFNLRGWKLIDRYMEHFTGGDDNCCRLLIGMQKLPKDQLRDLFAFSKSPTVDQGQLLRIKRQIVQEFRQQLIIGAPTNDDEEGLQRLKQQLVAGKLRVKLYVKLPLHAKLYLLYQHYGNLPAIAFLGSSNLTFSGLSGQGELNIDVLDHDATKKLQVWFEDKWNHPFSIDISQELIAIIEESWASSQLIPPYYVYLKIAYHLSAEAREGLNQYAVPSDFNLFDFQEAAVRIAANSVMKKNGVIVGDVVGLGKTIVGSAIAKICQDELGVSLLVICPKNLVSMWQSYLDNYGITGKVISISNVMKILPNLPARFRLILIDESHNLRNRDGLRYAAIKDYIAQSASRCILLTATPYNKSYLDLSSQLRLFIDEYQDLGFKPETLMNKLGGESEFKVKFAQIPVSSLAAFEKSEYYEDWQILMSKYLIRRTRRFIKENYAFTDPDTERKYLLIPNGDQPPIKSYFPKRIPKTLFFKDSEDDFYTQLYSENVVNIINSLSLPRYGLGNYELKKHNQLLTSEEQKQLADLSRAGRRLMGFCRTNLFKRLESSGMAFLQSLERHILRNYVYLHAINQGLNLPIGTQDTGFLDQIDEDMDSTAIFNFDYEFQEDNLEDDNEFDWNLIQTKEKIYQQKAAQVYELYGSKYEKRFKWLRPTVFNNSLAKDLRKDALSLIQVLNMRENWSSNQDQKFLALLNLMTGEYPQEKILIFTQFADTTRYLYRELSQHIPQVAMVTGDSKNPSELARKFSPHSNNSSLNPEEQIRVLIATDVLSEGQNLQDCWIIVNYDLPWAIIRLIQRAGRIDRIGQQNAHIYCYSFLPAEGVEKIINLRGRLGDRLQQNAEVVGTDETFFEDSSEQVILDLYHEKANLEEVEEQGEVDLTSEALQIWQNSINANPNLAQIIPQLPKVIYATRDHQSQLFEPEGVLTYIRTPEGVDALAWIDKNGQSVTQSQQRILRMAKCSLNTPAFPHHPQHHDLVNQGAKLILQQQKRTGGQLGHPQSPRAKTYRILSKYLQEIREKTPLLAKGEEWETLNKTVEEMLNHPLCQTAIAKLSKKLKQGISDRDLADLVILLRENNALCVINSEEEERDLQLICSLGLFQRSP
jgi:superfamily II DNA or RNA helicase/HKD family nuclease